ncbi:MAG: heme-binding protein [Lachnospiraceae bacterium]
MEIKEFETLKEIVSKQEEMLRFDSFTNKDAWELGKFMVERIYNNGIELAVSIRKCNGTILFQHETAGTNLLNDKWLGRKCQTVILREQSSFGAWVDANITGETVESNGLDPREYVFIGGGFPIKLKTGEMVGVLLASNLPQQKDHQFVVDTLSDYLGVKDVPSVLPLFE